MKKPVFYDISAPAFADSTAVVPLWYPILNKQTGLPDMLPGNTPELFLFSAEMPDTAYLCSVSAWLTEMSELEGRWLPKVGAQVIQTKSVQLYHPNQIRIVGFMKRTSSLPVGAMFMLGYCGCSKVARPLS